MISSFEESSSFRLDKGFYWQASKPTVQLPLKRQEDYTNLLYVITISPTLMEYGQPSVEIKLSNLSGYKISKIIPLQSMLLIKVAINLSIEQKL